MAVRYVVVPNHNGPAGSGAVPVATPGDLLAGLQLQTDLQVVNVDPNYTVYQNAAWAPLRAVLPPAVVAGAAARSGDLRALQETDLTGATPALDRGGPTRASGPVPPGSTVYVAQSRESGWRLQVAGTSVRPQPAFGWGMSFSVPAGHPAATATGRPGDPRLAAVLGVASRPDGGDHSLAGGHFRGCHRPAPPPRQHPQRETVRLEWFAPLEPWAPGPARASPLEGGPGTENLEDEELWVDA